MLGGNRGFNCDDCETDWALGVAGLCDEENGKCICPDGYSGKDDWVITQTCHVNESAVLVFHRILFCLCVLALLVNSYTLFQIVKSYSKNTSNFSKRAKHVFRVTVFGFVLFFIYTIFFSIYSGLYAISSNKVTFEDYGMLLPILGGLGTMTLITSYNIFFYTWYKSLPNISQYGYLLDYPAFILKYPRVLPSIGIISNCCYLCLVVTIFFILPLLDQNRQRNNEDDEEILFGQKSAYYLWPFLTLTFLFNLIYPLVTIISLIKLYNKALAFGADNNPKPSTTAEIGMPSGTKFYNPFQKHEKSLRKVVKALKVFTLLLIIFAPFQTIMNIFCWIMGGFYQYIFVSGSIFALMLIAIIAPITTLKNTVCLNLNNILLAWWIVTNR